MFYKIKKALGLITVPQRYVQLFDEIKKCKPQYIMEVGTWNGLRAKQMIETAATFSDIHKIHYYGFDLFEEMSQEMFAKEVSKWPPTMQEVKKSLDETGADIHLYKGNTIEIMPTVVPHIHTTDFVFIDGGHSLETIKNDWQNTEKTMHISTVVIFDDYWADRTDAGCKPLIDSLDRSKFVVTLLPIIDTFNNTDFGKLSIQFAKVTRKN